MVGFTLSTLVIYLIVGITAGFLAGKITKGSGFGMGGNFVLGILGAIVGGVLFGMLGLSAYGLIGEICMATVGAIVLLWLVSFIKK